MELYEEITACFPVLKKLFYEEDYNDFFNCPFDALAEYHFSLGLWIRNNLLKINSRLYQLLQEYGFWDKDDMSSFIITLFYIDIHYQ